MSTGTLYDNVWDQHTVRELPTGETRSFLEDGDHVVMRGHADGDDHRIGFGSVEGTVRPASCQ